MDDCFIIPKIHCLHRAQVSINTNKKIKQRRYGHKDHVFIDFAETQEELIRLRQKKKCRLPCKKSASGKPA